MLKPSLMAVYTGTDRNYGLTIARRERQLLAVCGLSPQHLMANAAPPLTHFMPLTRGRLRTPASPTAALSTPSLESKQWPQNTH